MDGARRPYARSIAKEQPGMKKPRLSAVPNSLDGRPRFNQQRRVHMDRDSDSSDSLPAEHLELVSQYKIALSELIFNSKPIITNLSIIAGENLHAAKAIAATICAHTIEVAPDQKLPSLYLLDSIVKNIGKDYIKHFSSRLPEVFCNAYSQVDPSTRQSLRHLFVTWRAIFPPQALQVIERELGFTGHSNGSSSGLAASRADTRVQHPGGHSIHVNPKYLERQQLQTSRARGSGSDISESMVNSPKIAEAPRRSTGIYSNKSWADPFVKSQIPPRDQTTEPFRNKYSTMASLDTDYDSNLPGRANESFRDQGFNKPWHDYGSSVSGHMPDQKSRAGNKTGLHSSAARKSTNHDLRLQRNQIDSSFRNTNDISKTWENSEEEEYSWDEMNSKPTLSKDHWMTDKDDRLEVDNQYQDPRNLHNTGSRIEDEPSVDSAPHELTQVGARVPFSWSEDPHPPESSSTLSAPGSNIFNSEDYHTSLPNSPDIGGRIPYRSQQSIPSVRGQSFNKLPESKIPGIKVTTSPHLQTHGAAPSAMNSSVRRKSLPSLTKSSSIQPQYTSTERNQTPIGRPVDPRKAMLASHDRSSSSLRLQQSTSLPPPQKRKYTQAQQGKHEVSEVEPSGVEQHSPAQSSPSSLLNARAKDTVFGLESSIKPTLGVAQTPPPNAINSASDPISSLLSSLVARGLISSSSSDRSTSAPSQKPADASSGLANVGSITVTSLPLANEKSPPVTDEQSSFEPAANNPSCVSPRSEVRTHIGFEFRPDVMRNFHPDLVADLVSDLPHRCNVCSAKLKFQELLDRHMEWHESKVLEGETSIKKLSRRWYSSSLDWVMGIADSSDIMGELDEMLESGEPMVPADENQSACILCGELFEDFYSLGRNEWMFKGAVYLDISEMPKSFESNASSNFIVHSQCISEDSLHSLGMSGNAQRGMVEMEED